MFHMQERQFLLSSFLKKLQGSEDSPHTLLLKYYRILGVYNR